MCISRGKTWKHENIVYMPMHIINIAMWCVIVQLWQVCSVTLKCLMELEKITLLDLLLIVMFLRLMCNFDAKYYVNHLKHIFLFLQFFHFFTKFLYLLFQSTFFTLSNFQEMIFSFNLFLSGTNETLKYTINSIITLSSYFDAIPVVEYIFLIS